MIPLTAMLLLTGCAIVDEKLGQVFLERSGVTEQEDYARYEQYLKAGSLDEAGQYAPPDEKSGAEAPDGKIHVTFASNRYMEILYYTDAAMLTPLSTSECYLNPGDTIYAKLEEYDNSNSNLYRLAEYRFRSYDADGSIQNEYVREATSDVLAYTIPADFTGTELSVLPVGEYADAELSVSAYYVDDSGTEHALGNAGTWYINDTELQTSTAQVSPIEPYVLEFHYDTENYFYVQSEPDCFTKDPSSTGTVEFWEVQPTNAGTVYRVELHPYLTLSLRCNGKTQIKVGQGEAISVKKNGIWNGKNLRYGDIITIETQGECSIAGGDYQHIHAVKDPITDGYRYTLTVVQEPESNTADDLILTIDVDRVFDVELDTNCDYGSCTYKIDGKEVSGAVQLQEGQKLTLTYKIEQDNYVFAEKAEGIGGFVGGLVAPSQRTVEIPVTADLDGTVIDPDDYFDIVEKESATK